jgi:hypothetical protein
MKKKALARITSSIVASAAICFINIPAEAQTVSSIPGYVSHGINTYNGMPIGDYSEASPMLPFLHAQPAVSEIGVFQAGASEPGIITAFTDRKLPVATTRVFFDYFNPTGTLDASLVNVPLSKTGSNYWGFVSLDDRVIPTSFPKPGTGPTVYRQKGVVENPTVADWEKISGKLTVAKKRGGGSEVTVTIRNAFPYAIYTLWDIGAHNPLAASEMGYVMPLGGVPNVMLTDAKGCASKKIELNYDLLRSCKVGAASCTSYVSAFYHWDGQVYGASPAAAWAGASEGVYAANQMVWPTSGKTLIEPQTSFKPEHHGCNL